MLELLATLVPLAQETFGFDGSPVAAGVAWSVVSIVLIAVVCATVVALAFFFMIAMIFRRRPLKGDLTRGEAEQLEDVWRGLQKMEQRNANLETILQSQMGGRR